VLLPRWGTEALREAGRWRRERQRVAGGQLARGGAGRTRAAARRTRSAPRRPSPAADSHGSGCACAKGGGGAACCAGSCCCGAPRCCDAAPPVRLLRAGVTSDAWLWLATHGCAAGRAPRALAAGAKRDRAAAAACGVAAQSGTGGSAHCRCDSG
jgi:hypothetical protein